MPTVRVGDAELGYESFGEGPPLVFIMGFTASRHYWRGFHRRFADRFRVIAFDNRGVGESTMGTPATSIGEMADDVLGLLDALDVPRAHVFGVSMGGMIAQELTLKAPARVDHLALGCTHFGGKNRLLADPDVLAAFGRVGKQSAEATIRDLLAVNFTPAFIDAHPEVIEDLVRHGLASRLFPAIYSGQTRAIVGHDVETRLGEIGAPTLVVAGSEDRLIPPDNSRLLAARVPGAKLVVLPDIAHMFWIEAPDLAEAVLRRHLPS